MVTKLPNTEVSIFEHMFVPLFNVSLISSFSIPSGKSNSTDQGKNGWSFD